MNFSRSERERALYLKFLYPGTETLVNKLDIRDRETLDATERYTANERARQGLPPSARILTYAGFRAIHRHLFQDVYDWAGEERPYTTGRGAAPFAVPDHIAPWMEDRFAKLKAEGYLIGFDPAAFAERAAEHVNEINAAHPFIDGNGRTQRTWLRLLADGAGYRISLASSDRTTWNEASRIGFEHADHQPMTALIAANLRKHTAENSL